MRTISDKTPNKEMAMQLLKACIEDTGNLASVTPINHSDFFTCCDDMARVTGAFNKSNRKRGKKRW